MNAETNTQSPPLLAGQTRSVFYPTFFLCLFLGGFGAHRFYTGKIKTGLAQLVTLGGCGIWPVVDLITILLGRFKDKNGVQIPNVNPKLTWPIFAIALMFCGGLTSLSALGLAAEKGLFGEELANDIAKANAETRAVEVKAANKPDSASANTDMKEKGDTASNSPHLKYVGEYLCRSPHVVLGLNEDKSYEMSVGDKTFHGNWSVNGKTLTITDENGDMTFVVKRDGTLIETKNDWTFKIPKSKYARGELAGVFKGSGASSIQLHLNADGTCLMDFGEGTKLSGKWQLVSTDGLLIRYNEAPYNVNPIFYTIVSKDKLKELQSKEALAMNLPSLLLLRVK